MSIAITFHSGLILAKEIAMFPHPVPISSTRISFLFQNLFANSIVFSTSDSVSGWGMKTPFLM
jgi:hypothetical protein